jgi:hypothetical protein
MLKYGIIFVICVFVFYGLLKTEQYLNKNEKDKKKDLGITDYIKRILIPSIIVSALFLMFDGFTLPSWLGGTADEPLIEGDYFDTRTNIENNE